MHSHFLNKFIKETLYFSGWKLFLNRSNNENVVTNVTSPPFKKKFCPHKILANFQCEGGGWAETMAATGMWQFVQKENLKWFLKYPISGQ